MTVTPLFILLAVILLAPHLSERLAVKGSKACLVLALIFFIVECTAA